VDPVADMAALAAAVRFTDSKTVLDALNRSSTKLAKADPKDVQQVAAAQTEIINSYYVAVLEQARRSLEAALIASCIGLVFFLAAVVFLLATDKPLVGTVSIISGALVEVIAGINFYLYGRAAGQLAAFHVILDRTQRFLLANSLCESLGDPAKDEARAKLIDRVATAGQALSSS
jgi:hypothetical protein